MTTSTKNFMNLEYTFQHYANKVEYSLDCNDFYAAADHIYELTAHIPLTEFCEHKLNNLVNTVICKIRTKMKQFDEEYSYADLADAIGALTDNDIFTTKLTKEETDYLEQLLPTVERKQRKHEQDLNELFLTEDELAATPDDNTDDDYAPAFLARK